jgi:ABC-2 type transport system permease protein
MYLIVPIVAALILGSIYSHTYVDHIPIGIVNLDNSFLSRNIVHQFNIHPGFKVNDYPDSVEDANEEILSGQIKGAVIIPKDFYRDILQARSPKVLVLIDGSNLLVGNNIQGYSSSILSTLETGMQINVLQGKGMLPENAQAAIKSFSFTERVLYDPELSYLRYVYYSIVVFVIQIMFLKTIVDILLKKKPILADLRPGSPERKMEVREMSARILLNVITCLIGSTAALIFTGIFFHIPLRGSWLEYIVLMGCFLIALLGPAFLLSGLMNRFEHFCEFLSFTNILVFYTAGLVWPASMMPGYLVALVKFLWPMIYVLMPLKSLHVKGIGWGTIMSDITGILLYIVFWLPVGIYIYSKKVSNLKTPTLANEAIS